MAIELSRRVEFDPPILVHFKYADGQGWRKKKIFNSKTLMSSIAFYMNANIQWRIDNKSRQQYEAAIVRAALDNGDN